jgi:hypothetical protein
VYKPPFSFFVFIFYTCTNSIFLLVLYTFFLDFCLMSLHFLSHSGNDDVKRTLGAELKLSSAELSAITGEDVTVASVKALLVREHNDSQHRGKNLSYRQQLTYMRTHLKLEEKKTGEPILKIADLSQKLRNQFLTWTGMSESTLYQRIVIPLSSEECFKELMAVVDANAKKELLGQNKHNKPKELPIKALENLFRLNDSPAILKVLREILQQKAKPETVGQSATDLWYKKNAVDHIVRGVNWKPGVRDTHPQRKASVKKGSWRWPGKYKDFDDLCSEFPTIISPNIVERLFEKMQIVGEASKVRKPNAFEWSDDKNDGFRPPHKQIKNDLNQMPNSLVEFIEKARLKIERSGTGEADVTEVRSGSDTITFSHTRVDLPEDTFVQAIVADLSLDNAFDEVSEANHNYVAAFLELPDDMVQVQLELIISNVVLWTSSPALAVQVWCAPKQEQFVAEIMSRHLKRVERCFWWKPFLRGHTKKFQDEDVRVGYVGHVDVTKANFYSLMSTSVVVAPDVKIKSTSKRMNGLVAEQFFQRHAAQGDLVADFMCGSGAASIAAVGLGLSCLAVDIDEAMVCSSLCCCCMSCTTFLYHLSRLGLSVL